MLELVATLSVALVAVTAGVRLAGGSLGLHTALVVLLLAPEAYWPLRRVGAEFHAAAEGVATFEAVRDALAEPAKVTDGGRDGTAPAGEPLVLTNVSITHSGRRDPAVAGLNAVIPAVGLTVVTGPSGCGKSTLLDALAGLLPLSTGSMTADGRPIGGAEWQRQVAWLPQRPHFVAGSIADNLRLGREDASAERLWEALRLVALEERVRGLPQALDSRLGEDGATLSAGERARLALARIVVADRPWMLLDEPTAHLDELTEKVITDTLVELGRRAAVVVVAHRPALVAAADHRLDLTTPATRHVATTVSAYSQQHPSAPVPDQPVDLPTPRFGLSTLLAALASASGVALTATAGWLIVQASTHPAVLTMLVAIVAVRTFGLARPVLRYVERLRSHDAALRLLARRRVEVYDALVPLTPGRLGRRRGDLLTSIVDDVDSVVDRELRVRLPWRSYALVATIAAVVALVLFPAAAPVVTAGALVGGFGSWWLGRRGATAAELAAVTLRADLATRSSRWSNWPPSTGCGRRGAAVRTRSPEPATASGRPLRQRPAGRVPRGDGRSRPPARPWRRWPPSPPQQSPQARCPVPPWRCSSWCPWPWPRWPRRSPTPVRCRSRPKPPLPGSGDCPAPHPPFATPSARCPPGGTTWQWIGSAVGGTSSAPPPRSARSGWTRASASRWSALRARARARSPHCWSGSSIPHRASCGTAARSSAGLHSTTYAGSPGWWTTTHTYSPPPSSRTCGSPGRAPPIRRSPTRSARPGWAVGWPACRRVWTPGSATATPDSRVANGPGLGVARSLLADQPVLVLDEPAGHLDHATASELAHELLTGARTRSVLWITHTDVGLDLVDRVVDLTSSWHQDPTVDPSARH